MQELPAPSGMSTFSAELMTDSTSKAAKSPGRGNCSGRQGACHHDRSESDHGVHVSLAADGTTRHWNTSADIHRG